jgi:aryl-alcohol dehydrogenase
MTGAGAVMNSFQAAPGSSIAIFGVGNVGMSAVLAAVVCGCTTIIGVDPNPDRLKLAEELGATHTINPEKTDPVEAVRELTDGGAQYSLECVGSPQVLRQAVDVLPRLGVCGLTGVVPPGTEVSLDMDHIMNGRVVRGILGGDAIADLFIPKLIELHLQGKFPFDRMITYYPFDEIDKAVEEMEKGRAMKPVLRF